MIRLNSNATHTKSGPQGKFVEHGTDDEVILYPKDAYTKRLISEVQKIYEEWGLSTV